MADTQDTGRSPNGSGSRAAHEAASSTTSSPQASIPNAACRDAQRTRGIVRFKKLPVIIEAVRVNATDFNGSSWDGNPFDAIAPAWLAAALEDGIVAPVVIGGTDYAQWRIITLEGAVIAGPDDWIVCGVEGEIYPCRGDIFERTYAPAGKVA